MRVALMTTYRADRKEPLADMVERIHRSFLAAGLEPTVRFTFSDAPVEGFTSAVDRAIKKYPGLEAFLSSRSPIPFAPDVRQITNAPGTPGENVHLDLFKLLAILKGVPRSLPFHGVVIQLQHPDFGEAFPANPLAPAQATGIVIGDSWWINGRNRSLMSLSVVDADEMAKSLPSPSASVAAVIAECGKVKETTLVPMPNLGQATSVVQAAQGDPEVARRVVEIMRDFRARLPEIVEAAAMPHELPSSMDALKNTPLGTTSGPKKPALVAAFRPLGYDCKGDSGMFTLRRTTPGNLTVELSLDVGTWSNSLTASYEVHGLGFAARLPMPPARSAMGAMQYQIGDAERWQKIVENLAALVKELDRTFAPAIEEVSGPAPVWLRS